MQKASPTEPKPLAPVPKPASLARPKLRHQRISKVFLILVVWPFLAAAFYLYVIAADQYASTAGFTVRSEETSAASSLLGGLSVLTSASSSDTDVLYEFMQSQTLVERINARMDLAQIFSRPKFDPVFSYHPGGPIEDLIDYWKRMVRVSNASGTGLVEVQVRAFRPDEAQALAQAIVEESTVMINDLSTIARADATRYAQEELDVALARLKTARESLTRFRSQTRIVDPTADLQGQMGLLNSLDGQLADAFINLNMLLEASNGDDPRISQAHRRIDVIEQLIEQEREKFGQSDSATAALPGGKDYPTLVGEFERLSVDVEYASNAYVAAMASLDAARAEAQRQSRYLATYSAPTLPQSPLFPQRAILTLMIGLFLLLIWGVGVLVYYSLRDRR